MEITKSHHKIRGGQEGADAEAELAFSLIQHAERARSCAEAAPYLRGFLKIVQRSPHGEIYDPKAVSEVIGDLVLREVSRRSRESLYFPASPTAPPLEELIREVVAGQQQTMPDLLDGITEKIILAHWSYDTMKELAKGALAPHTRMSALSIGQIYDQLVDYHERNIGKCVPPSLIIWDEKAHHATNTHRVVYRATIAEIVSDLAHLASQKPSYVVSASFQAGLRGRLQLIEKLLEKCPERAGLTTEEEDDLRHRVNTWKNTNYRLWVQWRQDQLYDKVLELSRPYFLLEPLKEQVNPDAFSPVEQRWAQNVFRAQQLPGVVRAIREFLYFTRKYKEILEEDNQTIRGVQKQIKRLLKPYISFGTYGWRSANLTRDELIPLPS